MTPQQAISSSSGDRAFIAMWGHELRNPLAPIRAALDLMTRQDNTSFRRERDVIGRQVSNLARLIDDMLAVTSVGTHGVRLRCQRVGLRELLAHAMETAQPLLDARRHQLRVNLPTREVFVDADGQRLEQVFVNLLGNASRYTPEGGLIEIVADANDSECRVSVKDNGQGIGADALRHLFDLFFQENPGTDNSGNGLGIGLAVVKHLVALHGGTVTAQSKGAGHGSEFIVRLPLSQPVPTASQLF